MNRERLISLDVFRGLTVALMILVNNPGSWAHIYPPLRHAAWHGWTPTDLVFPFFLFIVGVAMSLSFARRLEQGAGPGQLVQKILTRSVIIFLLGLFLNGFPFTGGAEQWSTLRYWGVLQRIAACYLLAGLTVVLVPYRRGQWLVLAAVVLLYELGMRLSLVNGWGGGSFALENNFTRWLDLRLWGEAHLYGGAGMPFDPEGLWSTLPAVATALAGFFTGQYLRGPVALTRKLRILAGLGVGLFLIGQALHLVEPVNKQLWTVSYVILTAGLALVVLAGSTWVIDVRRWHRWTRPAVVFGSNALVVFVGSGIVARLLVMIKVSGAGEGTISLKHWLYSRLFLPWAGATGGSFLYAVAFILIWLAILWWLYRRRIFVKI
jgi:predicted acyltransferase